MKKLITIFFLVSAVTYSKNSAADWSETYGGDSVVSEFTMIARSILQEMENNSTAFDPEFAQKFKEAIETTKISSEDRLFLDGVEKDALNHTLVKPYSIEVGRARWIQYVSSLKMKEMLVLHEYLFTLHIDDSDYSFSNSLYWNLLTARMQNNNESNRLGPFFLRAAKDCDLENINTLTSMGVNLNYTDSQNRNALFFAAQSGCVDIVKKFISSEFPALTENKYSSTPWIAAFMGSYGNSEKRSDYIKILKHMIVSYLTIDDVIPAHFDPLLFPLQPNECDGQTMLTRAIIGVNIYSDEAHTKVELVRNASIIELYINYGASLIIQDSCGKSALDYAKLYNVELPPGPY